MNSKKQDKPEYSEVFCDENYEYRFVVMPREQRFFKEDPPILSEETWRKMGITQSRGWEHIGYHQ